MGAAQRGTKKGDPNMALEADVKKAIITLKKDSKGIEFFEGMANE